MLAPDTILQNRYRIAQRLGGGGMGDVYLATDLRLGRRVVAKENRDGDARQFQVEAHLLATLTHPNLPRVSDHFVEFAEQEQDLRGTLLILIWRSHPDFSKDRLIFRRIGKKSPAHHLTLATFRGKRQAEQTVTEERFIEALK